MRIRTSLVILLASAVGCHDAATGPEAAPSRGTVEASTGVCFGTPRFTLYTQQTLSEGRSSDSMVVGDVHQVGSFFTDECGNLQQLPFDILVSGDPTIATVDKSTGRLVAKAPGTTSVTGEVVWEGVVYAADLGVKVIAKYQVVISGATVLVSGATGRWTASASGATAPYTYKWLLDGVTVSTTASYSDTFFGCTNDELEVTATDATGRVVSEIETIVVNGSGGIGFCNH